MENVHLFREDGLYRKMQNALRLPEECLGNLQGERRLNYVKNGKKITGSFGGGSDASDIVLYAVGRN